MHLYSPGRLFGMGMNGDADELKLSMFDTSDPLNVSERNKLEIPDAHESPALENHKAMLIDSSRDLIGFAAIYEEEDEDGDLCDNCYYVIYGYSEKQGFYHRASIKLPDSYYDNFANTRALYIGDYIYVSNGAYLIVFDLERMDDIAWIKLPVSDLGW
jgi:uncharacterized secreted protein with C-terminal beta-propeller domain